MSLQLSFKLQPISLTNLQSWLLVFKFGSLLMLEPDLEPQTCKSCQYFLQRFFPHCLSVTCCFLCHQDRFPCHHISGLFLNLKTICLKIPSINYPCSSIGIIFTESPGIFCLDCQPLLGGYAYRMTHKMIYPPAPMPPT